MMQRAGNITSNYKDFQFWQHHNHPIEPSTNSMIEQRLDYIHNNPVEAGFIENPDDWIYSTARNDEVGQGVIDIYFVDRNGGR